MARPLVALLLLYGLYRLRLRRLLLLLLLLCAKLLPLLVHMVLRVPRIIGVVPRLLAAVADELATLRRSGVAVQDHGHPANSGEDSESRIVPKNFRVVYGDSGDQVESRIFRKLQESSGSSNGFISRNPHTCM